MATTQMPALKALSLTHVLYDPVHPLSLPLSLATLLPLFLFSHHFSVLLLTRRLTALHLLLGQLLNEILSLFLKRQWRSDRPLRNLTGEYSKEYEALMTGYGMPSSHAQFMGFLLAWSFGFVWFVMARQNDTIRSTAMERVRKAREVVFLLGLVGVSALVCYSRWHLQYHSVVQVLVGLVIGLLVGSAWIFLTEIIPLGRPTSVFAVIRNWEESWWRLVGGLGGYGFGGNPGGWLEPADLPSISNKKER